MKKYFILAAAALALGACSNDEGSNVANDGTINLTTEMRGGTRATDQDIQATQIANGKSVLVKFTTTTAAASCDAWSLADSKTASYTANGSGNLSTTSPVKWPSTTVQSGTVSIFAWAPNTKITADPTATTTTFSVEADQSTDDNYIASDYLYGTAAAFNHDAIKNPVLVKFDHMLAKVNVNLFTTDPTINLLGATVEFGDESVLLLQGTIQNDGSIAKNTGGTKGKIKMISSLEAANTCSAIIIPQQIASGKRLFTITLADGTTIRKYDLTVAKDFAAKKVYTYNITINDSETIVLSEQINDWITGTNESIIAN